MRTTALAHMLSNSYLITFFLLRPNKDVLDIISQNSFSSVSLHDELEFIDQLTAHDVVILDGYQFDTNYQRSIKAKGCALICIDDLHNKLFVSDIVINHAPGLTLSQYQTKKGTRVLLGLPYSLLRPLFLAQAKVERKITKMDHLLICFGGADPTNLTCRTLTAIKDISDFNTITIITGSQFQYNEDLENLMEQIPTARRLHSINEKEMVSSLLEADIGIVPASGILFECIACKLPVISGYYISNQRNIYEGFKDLGAFYDADSFTSPFILKALSNALKSDPATMVDKLRILIDGNSDRRLLSELANVVH